MRHEFAFYTPHLSASCATTKSGDSFTLVDEQLWHRLKHVLRAKPGVTVYLFDYTTTLEATLVAFEHKQQLMFTLVNAIKSEPLTPTITVLLPLLKREACADALYSCVELGANHIQLVKTEKSLHAWATDRDQQRCQNIMIAAAEQSKNFQLPTLTYPIPLSDAVATLPAPSFRIQCDPQGSSLWQVLDQVKQQKPATLVISVGPEGDLTDAEKALLIQNKFIPCALTPTVLRSTQALVVMLGALRSGSSRL